MIVQLKLFGGLETFLPDNRVPHPVETADGATIADVLAVFAIPEAKTHILLVNGRHAHLDHVLADGDTLSIFPPVAGG